jgi:hypothetical protein
MEKMIFKLGRNMISIMKGSIYYEGKGDIKQKLRLAMRQRKKGMNKSGMGKTSPLEWNGRGGFKMQASIKVKIEGWQGLRW